MSGRVFTLGGDIERCFTHWDLFDELGMDNETHTELPSSTKPTASKPVDSEQLRGFFDRTQIAMILIGMPGFDRQLARYPRLYRRIGVAHQHRPLDP